jgi:hypothetical protein
MITVHMAGIIYYDGCSVGVKRAFVPDGISDYRQAMMNMGGKPLQAIDNPRHYASLFVEADRYKADDWWEDAKFDHKLVVPERNREIEVHVLEFRIPTRAEITFPLRVKDKPKFVNLEKGLPSIQTIPGFVLDRVNPDTIAEIPITAGRIKAHAFGDVAIVQWAIENNSREVTITAHSVRDEKSLTLKGSKGGLGLEIVFANTPDLISSGGGKGQGQGKAKGGNGHAFGHFMLYDKLNKNRPTPPLPYAPALPEPLPELRYTHAYLKYIKSKSEPNPKYLGEPGCTPTCC